MDPISLIITALIQGAGSGVATDACKDAYKRLKTLIMRRLGANPEKRRVLESVEENPSGPTEALERVLTEGGLQHDPEAVRVARALLADSDPEGAAKGIYNVEVGGSVHGLVQGSYNTVTFGDDRSTTNSTGEAQER
jgi:hypothetical protein